MEFVYFPLEARALASLLALEVANQKYTFVQTGQDWAELKPKCPFGQVPILRDEGRTIAQSGAILRYIARKGNLEGQTDKDFAISEELLQEAEDIYVELMKAKNAPEDKKAKFENLFTTYLPKQFSYLGRLLNGDKFTAELTVGEITLFAVLKQILNAVPGALKGYKLEGFYKRVAEVPQIKEFLARSTLKHYWVLPEDVTAPESFAPEAQLPALEGFSSGEGATLSYFPVKARGYFAGLVAAVGGVELKFNNADWPSHKEKTPFGQLPVLEHNGIYIAQSIALGRYLGRIGKLLEQSDADYGISEMLVQEAEDIYSLLAKAKYVLGGKKENYEEVVNTSLQRQIEYLEKLLNGDKFTSTGTSIGEIALYAVFALWQGVLPDLLNKSQLAKFQEKWENDARVQDFHAKWKDNLHLWFKLD